MKKFHLLGLALLSVFAFGVITSASAFALEPEWLFNGAAFTGELEVLSETIGTLTLTDMKGGLFLESAAVLCSGFDVGHVTSATGVTTGITGLENESPPVKCTNVENCPAPAVASPVGLPWTTTMTLEGEEFVGTLKSGSKEVGWTVKCANILSDKCVIESPRVNILNVPAEKDVAIMFEELLTPFANCERGGAEQGLVLGEVLVFHHEGELSVSEE